MYFIWRRDMQDSLNTNILLLSTYEMYNLLKNERILTNESIVRNAVWSETSRTRLIDSILKGMPIGNVILCEREDGKYYIVDGLKRLLAIRDFMDGGFELGEKAEHRAGLKFSELPPVERRKIQDYIVNVVVIRKLSDTETKELYQRVNMVEP